MIIVNEGFDLGSIAKPSTFNRILGGISQALNIANRTIPLYQEVRPAFNFFTSLKGNNDKKNTKNEVKVGDEIIKSEIRNDNNPTFFA